MATERAQHYSHWGRRAVFRHDGRHPPVARNVPGPLPWRGGPHLGPHHLQDLPALPGPAPTHPFPLRRPPLPEVPTRIHAATTLAGRRRGEPRAGAGALSPPEGPGTQAALQLEG